ncbi:MAG: ATP-dependent DNA helicase [Opitutaceae bacterium]|jgi:ATP-dependent DNA helicase DinG|nr:ATP-dependent DNA helicase [Opitutaceae bacterium]
MIGLPDSSEPLPPYFAEEEPPPPSRAPELAARIFAEDGLLQTALALEHRPQQEQMARAAAAAMSADEPLLFEAGTGVGKSLAYLLPGIVHAIDQGRQLLVSTHTIALQEQLETKDLPLCRRVFAADPALEKKYAAFKSTVLVGKSNYLCTTRLATALKDRHELFATPEHDELQRIAAWAETSADGLRHELSPPPSPDIWETVNADSSACARKYCDCERCFYQRARARVTKASVIVVNHALLFAHLNAGGAAAKGGARGILFPDDFLVLDEAHTIADVATDHFGLRLSSHGVERMLKYLYNPKKNRGLLKKHGTAAERQLVADALDASQQFFTFLAERLLDKQPVVRVRAPGVAEPWLDGPLLALIKATRLLADRFDESRKDEGRVREELLEQWQKLKSAQAALRNFLGLADDKAVYWLERSGRRQTIVTLRNAPIDIAPLLRAELLRRGTSVLFTSATLAMGGRIEPFQRRIGAEDVRAAIAKSPFDYARHMRVYAASDIPLPTPREARLALDALADYIGYCALRVPGGSLVLFTSYSDMRRVADAIAPALAAARRPLLLQGADYSRTELARRMRAAGNAVLLGTDSFWTGIDVPGPALSQVIITRLPFEVPTHPVLEARAEWIRDHGGNPFNELTLPDALVKFRQGVGRLIRSKTDRGLVTLLDTRVLAKPYGRLFLESLPHPRLTRLTRENRDREFHPFE